ncbi:hypothetical protein CBM2585_A160003 [Cupriavidus taiwanensis]|nr:hypothetical protein CBM2585_A160003 [Cupriavidus taiwanensis]
MRGGTPRQGPVKSTAQLFSLFDLANSGLSGNRFILSGDKPSLGTLGALGQAWSHLSTRPYGVLAQHAIPELKPPERIFSIGFD